MLDAQVEAQASRLQDQSLQAMQQGREDLARLALQRKEALLAQVTLDPREPISPGHGGSERDVHDLVAGHGDGARRERGDAGQVAIVPLGMIAKHGLPFLLGFYFRGLRASVAAGTRATA